MKLIAKSLTPSAAKTELKLWQQQGKNLLALVKLQHSKAGFSLYIPGYRCNNWYRLGKQYYPSQQAALAAYGTLLDSLSDGVNSGVYTAPFGVVPNCSGTKNGPGCLIKSLP